MYKTISFYIIGAYIYKYSFLKSYKFFNLRDSEFCYFRLIILPYKSSNMFARLIAILFGGSIFQANYTGIWIQMHVSIVSICICFQLVFVYWFLCQYLSLGDIRWLVKCHTHIFFNFWLISSKIKFKWHDTINLSLHKLVNMGVRVISPVVSRMKKILKSSN